MDRALLIPGRERGESGQRHVDLHRAAAGPDALDVVDHVGREMLPSDEVQVRRLRMGARHDLRGPDHRAVLELDADRTTRGATTIRATSAAVRISAPAA